VSGAQNGEHLHAGATLAEGSYHSFRIEASSTLNYYDVYVDGTKIGTTEAAHAVAQAAFNGEVSTRCTSMNARAVLPDQPKRTLQYENHDNSGYGWNYFVDDRSHDTGTQSVQDGDLATDHAYSTWTT
jgi:hypothetical protein